MILDCPCNLTKCLRYLFPGGKTTEVEWFLGIPYAKPPIANRRFKVSTSYFHIYDHDCQYFG